MKKSRIKTSHLVSAAAVAGLTMGATLALAAHPPIMLYTYEEVAQQMGFPVAPVMVDATKKMGLPYSPKQTCGLGGCHDGLTVQDEKNATLTGLRYTISAGSKYYGKKLAGYEALADHAFHAALGFNEWMDNSPSGLFISTGASDLVPAGTQTGLNPQKPWLQSHGHNGKW